MARRFFKRHAMTQYALLFPGQGSQYVGMGKSFFERLEGARLVSQAEDILGFSLKRLMLEGPQSALTQTHIAQPAILLHSYAAYLYFMSENKENNLSISCVLGHSLGEYTDLVAAGVMSFEDAILVVHQRGRLMQEAVPVGCGIMAAVLGLEAPVISEILKDFSDVNLPNYAACANFNGPAQTVIAGTKLGIAEASLRLKEAGAKRVIELDVSAPFHCALMKPVQQKMSEVLASINFSDAQIPVISNVSAMPETCAERIKSLVLEQIASPVRFSQCIEAIFINNLLGQGFVELGPKNTLSGIVRKIRPQIFIANIDNSEDRI